MRRANLRGRRGSTAGVCLIAAAGFWWQARGAQDLAPEVLLLRHIKDHMREQLQQLPNCTCLATFTRFHQPAARGSKLQLLDTVRLEVVYSNGREWYSSPGESKSERDPVGFIAAGLIGDGMFGITLHNLFVADVAIFLRQGETISDGRPQVKYDFRFPSVGRQGLTVTVPGGSGRVGEQGSFWADRSSLDLTRLQLHITDIPPSLPVDITEYDITYAHTRIGEFDALLAQHADLHMRLTSGVEDYDSIDFTHCRVFESHSEITFGAAPPSSTPHTPPSDVKREPDLSLPALLRVVVQLKTPVAEDDSVGKIIEGRVLGDVRWKGKVAIENGAIVRGRIRRLDRDEGKGRSVVGLEFTELQVHGVPQRFFADAIGLEKRKGIQAVLRQIVELPNQDIGVKEITVPELPGVATFFVDGKGVLVPAGFQTVWRTRGPLHGVD